MSGAVRQWFNTMSYRLLQLSLYASLHLTAFGKVAFVPDRVNFITVYSTRHCLHCCKGDHLSPWRMAKSRVSKLRKPWTDCHEIVGHLPKWFLVSCLDLLIGWGVPIQGVQGNSCFHKGQWIIFHRFAGTPVVGVSRHYRIAWFF